MKKTVLIFICITILITGCSFRQNSSTSVLPSVITENKPVEAAVEKEDKIEVNKRSIHEIDLSDFFHGIDGCAVIYDENKSEYQIYNSKLAEKRASPCSTFKIISTLIGLKSEALKLNADKLLWNGTQYPIKEWNQDLTLKQAFQSSCVWYFRTVIDAAGKDFVHQVLGELSYGNCDISQWEGSGVNTGYDELNGFWLESSLMISPMEQVDVLTKIFSDYSDEAKAYTAFVPTLKEMMLIDNPDIKIYGKTGTGKKDSGNVNAWFVGFAEKENAKYYFCVRLDTPDTNISGQNAKEITINILNDYLKSY